MGGTVSSYTFVPLFCFSFFFMLPPSPLKNSLLPFCPAALHWQQFTASVLKFISLNSWVSRKCVTVTWRSTNRQTWRTFTRRPHTHTHVTNARDTRRQPPSPPPPHKMKKIRQNKTKQELAAIRSKYNSYWKQQMQVWRQQGKLLTASNHTWAKREKPTIYPSFSHPFPNMGYKLDNQI